MRSIPPLMVAAARGAAAGAAATFLMDRASNAISKWIPDAPVPTGEALREPATEKVARILARTLGVTLEGERKKKAGQAVHWSYGTFWGALYGATRASWPQVSHLFGLTFGLGLFAAGDEALVPALKLAPGPGQVPLQAHAKGLVAHLIYGAVLEGASRLLTEAKAG